MDDEDALALAAFLAARTEDLGDAASVLAGTAWTAKRIGDHDYEIRVVSHPLTHATAPVSGIADVQREDVAEWIAMRDPRSALLEARADHALIAEYARARTEMTPGHYKGGYVDALEWVIKVRAARFASHPDYKQEWQP